MWSFGVVVRAPLDRFSQAPRWREALQPGAAGVPFARRERTCFIVLTRGCAEVVGEAAEHGRSRPGTVDDGPRGSPPLMWSFGVVVRAPLDRFSQAPRWREALQPGAAGVPFARRLRFTRFVPVPHWLSPRQAKRARNPLRTRGSPCPGNPAIDPAARPAPGPGTPSPRDGTAVIIRRVRGVLDRMGRERRKRWISLGLGTRIARNCAV
jgi:hypothetical protein